VDRDSQGREGMVELSPTETVYVGRGLECAIRTDDGMVSRRHSQIRMEGGRYVVEDLGSANGTHLNNNRVQKQALGHTDVIQCGSLMIRFLDEGAINVVQQQVPMAAAPPPKRAATRVPDRGEPPPPLASGYSQPQPQPQSYGSQPPFATNTPANPYGAPPAMPANPYGAATPGSASNPGY